MKKLSILVYALSIVVVFMAVYMSNTRRATVQQKSITTYDDGNYKFEYKTIIIDGREYIATKNYYGYVTLCPKLPANAEK